MCILGRTQGVAPRVYTTCTRCRYNPHSASPTSAGLHKPASDPASASGTRDDDLIAPASASEEFIVAGSVHVESSLNAARQTLRGFCDRVSRIPAAIRVEATTQQTRRMSTSAKAHPCDSQEPFGAEIDLMPQSRHNEAQTSPHPFTYGQQWSPVPNSPRPAIAGGMLHVLISYNLHQARVQAVRFEHCHEQNDDRHARGCKRPENYDDPVLRACRIDAVAIAHGRPPPYLHQSSSAAPAVHLQGARAEVQYRRDQDAACPGRAGPKIMSGRSPPCRGSPDKSPPENRCLNAARGNARRRCRAVLGQIRPALSGAGFAGDDDRRSWLRSSRR